MTVAKFSGRGWRMDFSARVAGRKVRVQKACKGARNRTEALAMEQAERKRLEQRSSIEMRAPGFTAFADEFLEKWAEANNKPSEVDSKRDILRLHLTPCFGDTPLDELDDEDIEAFKARQIKAGAGPKSVNNQLAVLSMLFRKAREWKRIAVVPLVRRLKVPEPDFRFLTFEESARLADGAEPAWAPMIRLALVTGMRQGELLGLRWSDVQPDRIVVRQSLVRGRKGTPKSHKPREIPLGEVGRRAIAAARALSKDSALVFHGEQGTPLTKGACKWPLWNACKAAGLERIGWHVCRHTFASHLAMRGVPLITIQQLMGHSDIRQTMRYAHLAPSMHVDAIKMLDVPTGDHRGTKAVRLP